jgi:hypothetical protein
MELFLRTSIRLHGNELNLTQGHLYHYDMHMEEVLINLRLFSVSAPDGDSELHVVPALIAGENSACVTA